MKAVELVVCSVPQQLVTTDAFKFKQRLRSNIDLRQTSSRSACIKTISAKRLKRR